MDATTAIEKNEALARWLECDVDEIDESAFSASVFGHGQQEYLVLDDEGADALAAGEIEESLWAFSASWIVNYLPEGVGEEEIEALKPQCEGANEAILAMVRDRFEELVRDAISVDGRANFLSTYDGKEIELDGGYFAYRTN